MTMKLIDNIPVWGEPVDESALSQIKNCAKSADAVAMMADHHKGYAVPIGGVVAYTESISPSGVGFDIACGNKAVLLDIPASEIRANISTIMDDIWGNLSFGIGLKNKQRVDHELFDDPAWTLPAMRSLKDKARSQLGTIGSGNHYVDLFEDEQERAWIGVHFGSRGLGHKTATYFLNAGGAKDGMDVDPLVLSVRSSLGTDYLTCMHLAGRYAYAGRDWVCSEVAHMLGANILEEVHNHHNYAWRETHNGQELWVVRKGATPAFPGQRGFVGGSMGDNSVILEGVESEEARYSLYSTVHGAGRVMSRTAARGKINRRTGKVIKEGTISNEMMLDWVRRQGVELRGAGTDESPHCYKRLPEVLGFHGATVRILHKLKPIGVAMAGEYEFDPFKD
jgi:tRNA-splicing ligase RtcB